MPKLVCFSACLVWWTCFLSGHFSLWLGLKTCRSTRVHNNHLKVGLQLIFPQHQFTINPFQNLCLVTWWAYFWKALCSFEKSSFFPYRFLYKECIAKAEKDCTFVGHLFSFSAVRISLGLYQKKYSYNLVKELFMYFGHSVNWKKKNL